MTRRLLVGVAVLLEYPIALGFSVPVLLPLAGLALAQNACVFHFVSKQLKVQLSDDAKPSTIWLWYASLFGLGYTIWVFFDCDIYGKYLVLLGIPLSTVMSVFACGWYHTRNGFTSIDDIVQTPRMRNGEEEIDLVYTRFENT